ncbi:carboxypeptidase-like regulatory domain-containing protein [Geojedonia litorea]|uniref:Carboxypeptidase-like regulatory domain-containing protein n=1 Tax=Geojedonia litorea TaxID=1268269 RepID=A0ABV9MYY8_9FLAO
MKTKVLVILCICMFPAWLFSQETELVIEYPTQLFISDTLTIKGYFDGHPENTTIEIDGQKFSAISETSSQSSFLFLNSRLGHVDGMLTEHNFSVPLQLQLLKLNTILSKSNLKRGSRTVLELKVEGVNDSQDAIQIQLTNKTPNLITLDGGEDQIWKLPALNKKNEASKNFRIRGIKPGNFNLNVSLKDVETKIVKVNPFINNETLSENTEAEEEEEKIACGSIYGKVENNMGLKFQHIVVFVKSECDLCPPAKAIDSVTITYNCEKIEPSWVIAPKGATVVLKSSKDGCDFAAYQVTKFSDETNFDDVVKFDKPKSFIAKEYFEFNDIPRDYAIINRWNKRADMTLFIAPNSCYSEIDQDGNYEIGELPPGDYTLKVYTNRTILAPPEVTVTVRSNERTRQDFELNRSMRKLKKKTN